MNLHHLAEERSLGVPPSSRRGLVDNPEDAGRRAASRRDVARAGAPGAPHEHYARSVGGPTRVAVEVIRDRLVTRAKKRALLRQVNAVCGRHRLRARRDGSCGGSRNGMQARE